MGFGILEPRDRTVHVAGTVVLDSQAANVQAGDASANLKMGTGSDSHLILAPQPSDDPNDPLNWSWLEKEFHLAILCFGAIINASALGPLTAAGTVDIAIALGVTVEQIAVLLVISFLLLVQVVLSLLLLLENGASVQSTSGALLFASSVALLVKLQKHITVSWLLVSFKVWASLLMNRWSLPLSLIYTSSINVVPELLSYHSYWPPFQTPFLSLPG